MRGERAALVAGLLVVTIAVIQVVRERPVDWWLWATGLALVVFGLFRYQLTHLKLGPSGIDLAVDSALPSPREQLAKPTQPADLKLLISTGIPVGFAETAMGTDHIVQVTAINTGDRPLGVNSLGLLLSDGRYIPAIETLPTPTNVRLPAVLQPQKSATTWLRHDALRDTLVQEGVRLDAILAHMVDGTTRRESIPDGWRRLGTADS